MADGSEKNCFEITGKHFGFGVAFVGQVQMQWGESGVPRPQKSDQLFFLKLMHIQNGGRYQHVLTYSSHNNALRITYQRANLL